MLTVRHILAEKGSDVYSVTPESKVYDALRLMAEHNLSALIVLKAEKIVGMLSERDYARKIILKGKASKETAVSDIMSKEVFTVRPAHTVEECMSMMTDKHIRHL